MMALKAFTSMCAARTTAATRALALESPLSLHYAANALCSAPLPSNVVLVRHAKGKKVRRSDMKPSWFETVGDPPVLNVEEMERRLETEPELRYRPIRPAQNFQNASLFQDFLLQKFTHMIMVHNEREIAREVMRKTFRNIKRLQFEKMYKETDAEKRDKIVLNPNEIFHKAITNATPVMRLSPVRRGGITYQVPAPVGVKKAVWTAMTWFILAAREKGTRDKMWDTLAYGLVDAAENEGRVIKRKQDLHRQCEANKAYSHYRWAK